MLAKTILPATAGSGMRDRWFVRRLRAAWGELTPLAELEETPKALAVGWVLGRSQADARCYLVLSDRALVIVVKARRRGALLRFFFEGLAYLGPAVRFSGKRTYEVWTHGWPDGPRGLAFAVARGRRGAAFVALLEAAVRRQRPDLLSAPGAAVIGRQGHRLMEPSDLWLG